MRGASGVCQAAAERFAQTVRFAVERQSSSPDRVAHELREAADGEGLPEFGVDNGDVISRRSGERRLQLGVQIEVNGYPGLATRIPGPAVVHLAPSDTVHVHTRSAGILHQRVCRALLAAERPVYWPIAVWSILATAGEGRLSLMPARPKAASSGDTRRSSTMATSAP